MRRSPTIAIIGAGSAEFSGGIVRDLCVCEGLRGCRLTLMDIDETRLARVRGLGERLSRELKADLVCLATTNRKEALAGADFVINTAQVGGHDWVETQRAMAEQHGYYRGTFLPMVNQMRLFLDVAHDVERICPEAWLIQSANPVFEGCTLMVRETKAKVLGLCHGHYGYFEIATALGLDRSHVSAKMPGFNHFIWLTDFRYKGEDAYPLLDEWIRTKGEERWSQPVAHFADNQLSRAAIHQYRLYGLMPIGDTPRAGGWWYHGDLAAKKKWYGSLGGFDSEIGWRLYLDDLTVRLVRIEHAAQDMSTPASEVFPPVQSGEQIVPIIDSIVNDRQALYQVNIRNDGHLLKGFPEDLVVECQGVVDGSGIHGVDVPPLPSKLVAGAMNPRWAWAERLIEAVRSGDRGLLLLMLLEDHRTRSLDQAESLLSEWFGHALSRETARHFSSA